MNETQLSSVRMIADTCKTKTDEWEKEKTAKQRSSEENAPKNRLGPFGIFDPDRHTRRQVSCLCLDIINYFNLIFFYSLDLFC